MVGKHPWLHHRGGRYYLRAKVPVELVGIIGKSEIKFALRTADLREAKRRIHDAAAKVENQFAEARLRVAAIRADAVPPEELRKIAVAVYRDELRGHEEWLRENPNFDPDQFEAGANAALWAWETGLTYNEWQRDTSDHVKDVLATHGVILDPKSPGFADARRMIARAVIDPARAAVRQARGDYSSGPRGGAFAQEAPLPRSAPQSAESAAGPSVTLGKLIELYMTDPERRGITETTKKGYNVIFRLLREVIGEDAPVSGINRASCREVRDVLVKLPPNATKRFPGKSAKEAARLAAKAGLAPVAVGTAQSYLQNLSALFRWAVREEYMARNPAEALPVVGKVVRQRDKRDPFTIEQLQAIFSAPLYTGCRDDRLGYSVPGPNHPRRGRFWIPLLALWTGGRLGELCQLDVDDVRDIDGVPCLVIAEDPEGSDEEDRKRVKTSAGERFVPVHPELQGIGFLKYAEKMREAGERKVFPELRAGVGGYSSNPMSQWFSRFLTTVGAKARRTSFHSLRHTYRDALREANISRERVRALGGWAGNGGTEDDYGSGLRARTLYEEICKLAYDGLDLSRLYAD